MDGKRKGVTKPCRQIISHGMEDIVMINTAIEQI